MSNDDDCLGLIVKIILPRFRYASSKQTNNPEFSKYAIMILGFVDLTGKITKN